MVALQLLSIAGGIGLFLYGIKLFSESTQKLTGDWLREFLKSMTRNRFRGLITGLLIASVIQSSSATTILVVSFVNAGFLRLIEAMSVILGANIGTTITAWLITILGFKIDFTFLLLPIIAITIPLTFARRRVLKTWGEAILGFSLMFIAISLMRDLMPVIADPEYGYLFKSLSSWGYGSYFLFLLAGLILTMIFQNSLSVFIVTILLANAGWVNLECAFSIVIGANVGASIATVIASRKANSSARQTAMAHMYFNLFGVVWSMSLLVLITRFFNGFEFLYNDYQEFNYPIALSMFHSAFNLFNALFLIGFTEPISLLISSQIQQEKKERSNSKLTHLKIGLLSTPDASIFQARKETIVFAEKVQKMFQDVVTVSTIQKTNDYSPLAKRIISSEDDANIVEKEIAQYLTKVGEVRLSEANSRRIRALYKMVDDIESIADSNINILEAYKRKNKGELIFPERVENNIALMFHMVDDAINNMVAMLTNDEELPLSLAQDMERDINNFRDILKSEHLDNLQKGVYNYDVGIVYNDVISQCERIGDYTINVVESYKNLY